MPRTPALQVHRSPHSEALDREPVKPIDTSGELIWTNAERVSGAPCFAGTRVPVKHMWDYLKGGEPLEEFLEGFPGVTSEQALGVLELAYQRLLEGLPHSRP